MTSPKQQAANRRNAQRSTGPKSESGRRSAAINALKHGLSSPIESTVWGSRVIELEALLQSEGLVAAETRELARRVVEYERNLAYQRQRFQDLLDNKPMGPVVSESAQRRLDLEAELQELRASKQTHSIGLDRPLAREIQKFFEQFARWQIRTETRAAVNELKNADRYLRRAANQLIKQLKSVSDL